MPYDPPVPAEYQPSNIRVYSIPCVNRECKQVTVVGIGIYDKKQYDILPAKVFVSFPEYIPQQIRQDYEEASAIISDSPKAAATLLRRCLQGMIRDYWGVKKDNLCDAINTIKDSVSVLTWEAIDAVRQIGNIGAHMEKDINLIIDIDEGEAEQLQKLIEYLIHDWYIERHNKERLLMTVRKIADDKQIQRKMHQE